MNRDINSTLRLLVIDPDAASAKILVTGMQASGWRVDHVTSLQEAVLLAAHAVYDFVILELVLPDATAADAWDLLRKIFPGIPGVVTTSSRTLYQSVAPRLPGIIAFIPKPIE